ncbi:MAG: sigma-54 dependent transcriptional regulator [Candidatus Omnitrophota bacterium]
MRVKGRILVVDDNKTILTMVKAILEAAGYEVATALSADNALSQLSKREFDLAVMDIKMPGTDGLDALLEIKKINEKLPVIIMTAYGTMQTAVEAMKRGAYDYISKPFNKDDFLDLIKKAQNAGSLMRDAVSYKSKKEQGFKGDCVIGNSSRMQEIYKAIGQVAESNATVLIRGESGTGKELVCRAIYHNSLRREKPFLAVNCAAIPESLLESELFGHERGSFTGAINKRIGKFQQCDGGTIFLDEIGDMPLSTQTKVLRVLQEYEFEPVGSEKTVKVDVRVIASTNRDLEEAILKGEFREDLYYRLKVVSIFMPPLRERLEDFCALTDYFIKKFNRQFNKNVKGLGPGVIEKFKQYRWPGNVRELENAIQTAVVMSKKNVLFLDDFSLFSGRAAEIKSKLPQPASNYEQMFKDILSPILKDSISFAENKLYKHLMQGLEKTLINMVLKQMSSSQAKAARVLGISRNTLRARMKEYGLL